MPLRYWLVLLGFVAFWQAVGGLGSWLTFASVQTWYPTLVKPPHNPPDWVFGPVWTTLYLLLAVSGWLVWKHDGGTFRQSPAIWVAFALNAVLNLAWSFTFFTLQAVWPSVAVMALLWLVVLRTLLLVWREHRLAGWLLVPYTLWVSYAATVNVGVALLNPGQ